jgi:hypothetical protein
MERISMDEVQQDIEFIVFVFADGRSGLLVLNGEEVFGGVGEGVVGVDWLGRRA